MAWLFGRNYKYNLRQQAVICILPTLREHTQTILVDVVDLLAHRTSCAYWVRRRSTDLFATHLVKL